jgi:transposase-like protein
MGFMASERINLNTLPQDENAAREMLESMRWPNGAVGCPHCGGADPYKLTPKAGSSTRQGVWKCRECRKQFTVTVGTIFESSHIKLTVWLKAIYLLCSSKKGMSAHQLHRMLGITYKAAWFMAHRLRYAMTQEPFASKLSGIIEADDTYIGARKKRGTQGGRPGPDSHKSVVMALVERGGRVRAFPIARVTSENLSAAIREHVDIQNSTLMTDSAQQYTVIGREFDRHEVVNHTKDEYVRGDAYTNTVEGFFSLLKRGITGSYHHVGKGHLHRYCDEFAFRYDRRKVTDLERSRSLVLGAEGKRLKYRD